MGSRGGESMSEPSRSRVLGWGMAVPELVVTNDQLGPVVDTSDEWIQKRTGIQQRRYIDREGGSVELAAPAVRDALEMAGVDASQIDAVICASLSPDIDSPGNSSLLHAQLGIEPRFAFDVRNQCSGFIYSLATADQLVRSGSARNVLVLGSEIHSAGLDFNGARGRDVTVLFGDGAGAVVVGPSDDDEHGLLGFTLGADGQHAERLCVIGPAHRDMPRLREDNLPPQSDYVYPKMAGRYVFKHAVQRMVEAVREVTSREGLTPADVDIYLPHQANLRINQFVALELELREDQVVNNIESYANTTAATIPILLTESAKQGRVNRGDLVCMVAFGAGFTWGAALLRW